VRRNDSHTHVGMPKHVSADSTAESLIRAMDLAGVDKAAVVTPSKAGGNRTTFDALAAFPSRFVAIALVDLTKPTPLAEAASVISSGAKGIRFNLISDPTSDWLLDHDFDPFWMLLAESRTVADFHASPDQLPLVGELAVRHPQLTIVIDHLGRPDVSGGPDSQDFVQLLELSASANISVKTPNSSAFSATTLPHSDLLPFIEAVLRSFGAKRLLWGSDWPVCVEREPYGAAIAPTDQALATYTDADKHAVFAGNFSRIFGCQI
jgi:L-fuconolactonase